ncbi:MAG: HEPN domain-containing protein [Deltaproteobacteria bacterium]|nr:HEPN domain-containing protein [Deltaproteobacteria bacterium]MCL5277196.1 HEPN domain-containing protein [Deltaproteobacteria bacterium]
MNDKGDIEVIKTMLTKASDRLEAAQSNFENKKYDVSVSCSYYAVFHSISSVLQSRGLRFSSHRGTIGSFNKEFVKTKEFSDSFTKTIEKLFYDRQIGDYSYKSSMDIGTAREDLKQAGDILNGCKEYLAKVYKVEVTYWESKAGLKEGQGTTVEKPAAGHTEEVKHQLHRGRHR